MVLEGLVVLVLVAVGKAVGEQVVVGKVEVALDVVLLETGTLGME